MKTGYISAFEYSAETDRHIKIHLLPIIEFEFLYFLYPYQHGSQYIWIPSFSLQALNKVRDMVLCLKFPLIPYVV